MIFVDAHVHIYDCFDVEMLLDSAMNNLQAAAKKHNFTGKTATYILLLAEGQAGNYFEKWQATLDVSEDSRKRILKRWFVGDIGEEGSFLIYKNDFPEKKIHLVAGRQVVTKENIEVLALFYQQRINDGLSLSDTVDAIIQSNGIPVLPWGAGKWLGTRGKMIKAFLAGHQKRVIFLGDNGSRPRLWPTPPLFTLAQAKGIAVLPGSDPLPLPGEDLRVGSFGFYLQADSIGGCDPVAYLKNALLSQPAEIFPFGHLQDNRLFFANQLRLRLPF